MITRFKRLSVQYKLFVVITPLAAAGAASILANLFTLIGFYSLGSELDRIYARNQEIYHTHQILQTLELGGYFRRHQRSTGNAPAPGAAGCLRR